METENNWQQTFTELDKNVNQWRENQQKATLSQIQVAVEKELAVLQKRMVEDLIKSYECKENQSKEICICPECTHKMHRNGKRKRILRDKGGQELELERDQLRCPECGTTIFPPR